MQTNHRYQRNSSLRFFFVLATLICCVALAAFTVFAHDPGLSSAKVEIKPKIITVELTLAQSDVEFLLRGENNAGQASSRNLESARMQLLKLSASAIEIWTDDKRAVVVEDSLEVTDASDTNAVTLAASYSYVAGNRLTLRSTILTRLPRGHRQYLSVINSPNEKRETMLDGEHDSIELDVSRELSTSTKLGRFIALGVEHIWTGYDHLAFLFAVLIVVSSIGAAARLITSFTIAHSITLALAVLGVVRLSSALVEPLIAVSIVFVGIENLLHRGVCHRWLVTFAFGLIHGFGFAGALTELGIGRGTGIAIPLFGFNLGVELGQVVSAVLIVPMICKLRKYPAFNVRVAPACSLLVALAGIFWVVQRL
jgi:hydrogenase/urease accessory protein HupE